MQDSDIFTIDEFMIGQTLQLETGKQSYNFTKQLFEKSFPERLFTKDNLKEFLSQSYSTIIKNTEGRKLAASTKRQYYNKLNHFYKRLELPIINRQKIDEVMKANVENFTNDDIIEEDEYFMDEIIEEDIANEEKIDVHVQENVIDAQPEIAIRSKVITDDEFRNCSLILDNTLECLSDNLTVNSDIKTLNLYKRAILMILYVKLPVRASNDYCKIRTNDDTIHNFYSPGRGSFIYRNDKDGAMLAEVHVPVEYLKFVNNYYEAVKDKSEYFLFTDKQFKMYGDTNYSNFVSRTLGHDAKSFIAKWKEIIENITNDVEKAKMKLKLN